MRVVTVPVTRRISRHPLRLIVHRARDGRGVVLHTVRGGHVRHRILARTPQQIVDHIEREWPVGTVVEWHLEKPKKKPRASWWRRLLGMEVAR
jgi:hypothetical protein